VTQAHQPGGGASSSRRGGSRPVGPALRATVGVLLTLGLAAGCAAGGPTKAGDVPATAAAIALTAPSPAGSVPAHLEVTPAPGTVAVVDGPFTDRVVVHDAMVEGDVLTARLDVVKDVSELLALEIDVAWYDAEGQLVGSVRHVVDLAEAEEYHSTAGVMGLPLDVAAPGGVSATLAIPVLVNE
jgi:hypothetical protein